MNRYKKMELSDYLNHDIVLKNYQCFNYNLEMLYNRALQDNIELQYNKKNLLEYIKDEKELLLRHEDRNEKMKSFEKKNNRLMLKKGLFKILLFLSLYSCYVAGKNIKIQEESNVANTYLMLKNLVQDSNDDEILEINTELLNYINGYSNPGDNKFFYNSNFIYRLSDNVQISDCVSFDIVMDKLDYELIEIDDIIYSNTGNMNKITFCINGEQFTKYTSQEFESDEYIKDYLTNLYKCKKEDITCVKSEITKVSGIEEIPTIKKSKKDGNILLEEPSKVKQKVLKKLF